jgi:RNA polymerase sigma-70 factor (ECF subfamily)
LQSLRDVVTIWRFAIFPFSTPKKFLAQARVIDRFWPSSLLEETSLTAEIVRTKFVPEGYRAYLHTLARMRLHHGHQAKVEASDVVQQTLLQAYAKRGQFKGGTEAEWKGWLRQILANVIADAFRKQPDAEAIRTELDQSASRLEAFLPSVTSSPSRKLENEERLLRLTEALETLTDDERTALQLRHFEDPPWKYADIAKHLNRPTAKAVAGLHARALEKLRGLLREES